MRLQSLIPILPSDLVAALEDCSLRTDADLLFSGSPIDILQKLPPGIVSLVDLKRYIALVAERASARGIRGDELYTERLQRQHDYDTNIACGVDELDALVNGFGNGRVFEISGDRGSGKTSLVLQIALRLLAAHEEASVLWMDTTGDFSVQRTSQVARELLEGEASTVLERLQVSVVFNVETAHGLLANLESLLVANVPPPNSRVRLVVIDPVTPLLAPSLSAVSSYGHAVMTTFMQQLRTMARTYYLAFLKTSAGSFLYLPHGLHDLANQARGRHQQRNLLNPRGRDLQITVDAVADVVHVRNPKRRFAFGDMTG